ncbi:MAG: hypothetical protein RIF39_02885, partial [Cyclobacteriaceae bacterium]
STSFTTISYSSNRINQLIAENKFEINSEEKSAILGKMIQIFIARAEKSAVDNDDRSKLAWLYLHDRRVKEAKQIVKSVLEEDPEHFHCLNLSKKLNL